MHRGFSICFIGHDEFELMERTLRHNVKEICSNTNETYELVLHIDGAEVLNNQFEKIRWASQANLDEIRLHFHNRRKATGDGSNNGHFHVLNPKFEYLVSFESDIVLFVNNHVGFDLLREIRDLFERNSELFVLTRMDDTDEWVWKLEDVGPEFEKGLRSVNRVSSHFLVYHTARCLQHMKDSSINFNYNMFYDNGGPDHFNYEDWVSKTFVGHIGFIEKLPIRVFHCDKKIHPQSLYYTKDPVVKMNEFNRLIKLYHNHPVEG